MDADMTDYAGAYHELRERITDLVRSRPDDVDTVATATPEWRVRDVIAHLAGVCDDVSNGNLTGVASDPWTAAQVAKRRDWPFEQVLADWETCATAVEPLMASFPPVAVGQMVLDAATHEADILGTLGEPGGRDASSLDIAYEWCTDRLSERLVGAKLGTLHVETEIGTKELGEGQPVATVRTSRFELMRATTGRRSRAQLQAFDWDGDLDPAELLLSTEIFTLPGSDLVE